MHRYTALVTNLHHTWIATFPDVPPCAVTANTPAELRRLASRMLSSGLSSLRAAGKPLPVALDYGDPPTGARYWDVPVLPPLEVLVEVASSLVGTPEGHRCATCGFLWRKRVPLAWQRASHRRSAMHRAAATLNACVREGYVPAWPFQLTPATAHRHRLNMFARGGRYYLPEAELPLLEECLLQNKPLVRALLPDLRAQCARHRAHPTVGFWCRYANGVPCPDGTVHAPV